jgi:hypothetical protein
LYYYQDRIAYIGAFQSRMLRKIFGLKREDVAGRRKTTV